MTRSRRRAAAEAGRAAAALALTVASAAAEPLSPAEAEVLPRVIASLCLDLHPGTGCETAILLQSAAEPDTADLVILTDRRGAEAGRRLAVARSLVFSGAMWGMAPGLRPGAPGTLAVTAEQIGVGRNAWMQELHIAHGPDGFAVTEFSWSGHDRLTGGSFSCRVDFATGNWEIEATGHDAGPGEATMPVSETGRTAPAPVPLARWRAFAALPEPCAEAYRRHVAARE